MGQTPRLCSLPSKSFSNNINVPFTGGGNLVKESGKPFNGILYSSRHKTDINYSSPFFSLSLRFLILLGWQAVRELKRGGVGPHAGQAGASPWWDLPGAWRAEVPPWSDLPLDRILYIPFSIFAYSSNIFIANLDLMSSMRALGTLCGNS